jgi:hypothetical protein
MDFVVAWSLYERILPDTLLLANKLIVVSSSLACYMLGLLERRNFWTSHRGGTIHRGSKNIFFFPPQFFLIKKKFGWGSKVCMYVCVRSIMEWAFIYPPHQGKGREGKGSEVKNESPSVPSFLSLLPGWWSDHPQHCQLVPSSGIKHILPYKFPFIQAMSIMPIQRVMSNLNAYFTSSENTCLLMNLSVFQSHNCCWLTSLLRSTSTTPKKKILHSKNTAMKLLP